MKCSSCGTESSPGEKFCSSCGKPVFKETSTETFCPQCGTKLEKKSAFCYSCGYKFNNSELLPPKKQEKNQTFVSSQKSQSGNNQRKIILIVLVSIVLIVAIAMVVWFKNDPRAKEKLMNAVFGILFIGGFFLYIRRKAKRGKIRSGGGNYDYDDNMDHDAYNDYNDNDDSDDD